MSGDLWATPAWLFDWASREYGPFDVDVCASASNAKCGLYYDEATNGLRQEWGNNNWCNPPYSKPLPWATIAISQMGAGKDTCMLVKADSSTRMFRLIYEFAAVIVYISTIE